MPNSIACVSSPTDKNPRKFSENFEKILKNNYLFTGFFANLHKIKKI